MKFLLEFVTCYGSCVSSSDRRHVSEETRLLVVGQETRRRGGGGGRRKPRSRGGSGDWRPSLSSISEEAALMAEKKISSSCNDVESPVDVWRRRLKRKVSSLSRRDRARSSDRDCYDRRTSVSNIMPAYSATPFMF